MKHSIIKKWLAQLRYNVYNISRTGSARTEFASV